MQRWLTGLFAAWIGMWALPLQAANVLTDRNLLMPEYGKTWLTYTTPHFNIHFEKNHQSQAAQVAEIAERVHTRLQPWLGWQPREKTEIVLLDTVDASNGFATPLPFNEIVLYLQHPVDGELMDQQPWLEMLITHEYVHILHLDMADGGPLAVRNVFGRSMDPLVLMDFPQVMAPTWVAEGLAVYGESRMNGVDATGSRYGRLNSAWYEGLMRMEMQRGFYDLSEVSFNHGFRWPYGQQYLYGAYFFRFVAERYGNDAVANYIKVYGSNLIPFRMDKRAMQIFGKSSVQVWDEYRRYLSEIFEPQVNAIRKKGDMQARTLFEKPDIEFSLSASPDGALYFVHDDHASRPMVKRLNRDGTVDYVLDGLNVQEIDFHAQAGLLMNKWVICDNTNIHTDLFVWKAGMPEPRRITQCGRYVFSAWHPDGQSIAAVQSSQGVNRLVILDTNGNLLKTIAEFSLQETLGQIDWSPDGKAIVATIQRKEGWGLELLDVASGQQQVLLRDGSLLQRPHFSSDGKAVTFLSDHDKLWNLRRIMLETRKLETLSNTLSVLSDAVQMEDGSFHALENTSSGTHIISFAGKPVTVADLPSATQPVQASMSSSAPALEAAALQPYSPWQTVRPHAWFPVWDSTASEASYGGVLLQGRDALAFHNWQALPLYYPVLKSWGGLLSYSFYNKLVLGAENSNYMVDGASGTVRYQDNEVRYQAMLQHEFNSMQSRWRVAGGVASEAIEWLVYQGSGSNQQYRNKLAGGVLEFDNTRLYRRSVMREDGRHVLGMTETYDALGGSDYNGKTALISWQEYFSLVGSHVLYLRGTRAEGDAGIRPYRLGGASEALSLIGGQTGLGRRVFPLRGYPAGLAGLSGTSFALASVEWRMPMGYLYDGWMSPPVGMGRESISLFADVGDAWNAGEPVEYRTGVGAEWHGEILLGYDLLRLNATLGFARGLNQNGERQIYLKLALPMF